MADNNPGLWLIIVFALILYLTLGQSEPQSAGAGVSGVGGSVTVNVNGQPTAVPTTPDGGVDLCSSYTTNYPTYFFAKEIQCGSAGGDWECSPTQAGCYDITLWDHVYGCNTASDVQLLKAACSAMGGDWTCTATTVGCDR